MKPEELKKQQLVGEGMCCPLCLWQQLLGGLDFPRRAKSLDDTALPLVFLVG